jgi:hypothetical protein
MAISKNKVTIAALSVFLMVTLALSVVPANAQEGVVRKTYPFVDAVPDPVGVGEQVLIRFGILQQLPNVAYYYSGLTVTIEDESGHTTELGPFKTDSTGGSITIWTPDTVGTYKVTSHYPQQTWIWGDFFNLEGNNMILNGTIMGASTSETVTLVVNEEPLPTYPSPPLPTEYWTRPVDPQLREWFSITGNWVIRPDNSYAYWQDDAPETAHVLWAEPLTTGGLTGGLWQGDVAASSETGDAYEGKFPNAVVMNGILYYTRTDTRAELAPAIIGIDLHTGEQVFFLNDTSLSFGQILYFNSWNYDGVYTYLVSTSGTTWDFYDPFTGNWQFGFTDVPSGTTYRDPNGNILIFQMDYENNRMLAWNSTAAGHAHLGAMGPDYGSWGNSVHGAYRNASDPRAYTVNTTIPAGLQAGTSFFSPVLKIYPDRVMTAYWTYTDVRVWALDWNGNLLFDKTWSAPAEWEEGINTIQYGGATNEVENGVFWLWDKELQTHYAFSTETGNYLWQTESEHWLDSYGWGNVEHTWYAAYDHLYSAGVAGILYAYNLDDGTTDWTYTMSDAYGEPVTGENWWGWIDLIADGKIYIGTVEHSAEMPIPRGGPYICINATNGEEIWRVNGMFRQTRWGGCGVIGDSIIGTMDTYDQRVYAIGKGPTMTTVSAPDNGVPYGQSVMIRGTVKDVSPGTKSAELTLRFPSGVSAVSDENQSAWMLYVYKHFEYAPHETWVGVPVTLFVVDQNMNTREIGTATTSAENGAFAFAWTPDIPGTYYLYAQFQGSKAYFGSHAETAFVVDEALAEATPVPTSTTGSLADMYILPATIGIIVAIVVIGLIIILMLRKR